ncbi:MAG: TraX family protein [Tepidanaerobacteraceae bacterium]
MLELIAMTTMLVDHMGVVFFPDITAFRIIGRISFPIYCFLLTRGYCYTSNFNKYLLRLILLAFYQSTYIYGVIWLGVKSKLVCNFPRSSVNPLTHPHVNIRVTITVKIPNV